MVAAVRTPLHHGGSLSLGNRRYRKEILTKGALHVDGQTFNVSDEYLDEIKRAFDAKAIPSVPVQLAPGDNSHSEALDRRRGRIVGLTRTARGLDADVELNDEAANMISEWPDTGVSVLVKHDRTTGEGEHYNAALAHLLITADPVLTTLQPWSEAIAAAHDGKDGEVLDLLSLSLAKSGDDDATVTEEAPAEPLEPTAATPDTEAAASADPSSDEGAHPDPSEGTDPVPSLADLLSEASEDDLKALRSKLDELTPADAPADAAGDATSGDGTDTVAEATDDDDVTPSDDEIEAMLATADDLEADTPEQVAASHTANEADHSLALANMSSQLEEMRLANEVTGRKLAEAEWKTEKDAWIHANIPPHILGLCEPFLNGASKTLALSNSGEKEKVAGQLRKVLTEISKQAPNLGLSQGQIGTSQEADQAREEAEARAAKARQVTQNIR